MWPLHRAFTWTSLPAWAAKARLWRWTHPRRRVLAAAKPPVQQKLRESRAYVEHYAGAKAVSRSFILLEFCCECDLQQKERMCYPSVGRLGAAGTKSG